MSTRHKHPEGAFCAAGGFYPPLRFEWGKLLPFIQRISPASFGRILSASTGMRHIIAETCKSIF